MLQQHYNTVYFFSAKAFQEAQVVAIELQHIYRQKNENFIQILNEIRNDQLSEASATILNERYQPSFSPHKDEGYITLTTHNRRAGLINDSELNKLNTKNYFLFTIHECYVQINISISFIDTEIIYHSWNVIREKWFFC